MAEIKLLIDEESLSYEGLFSVLEFHKLIDDYLKLKGYDKFETENEESVYAEGKKIHYIITPLKWHTDYIRKALKIEIFMDEIKEVETEIDKVKVKLNQGKLKVLFSASLHTDWEGRFEQKPLYFLIRTIFDKYIYHKHTKDFESEVVGDLNELRQKVGGFLNLYRYRNT